MCVFGWLTCVVIFTIATSLWSVKYSHWWFLILGSSWNKNRRKKNPPNKNDIFKDLLFHDFLVFDLIVSSSSSSSKVQLMFSPLFLLPGTSATQVQSKMETILCAVMFICSSYSVIKTVNNWWWKSCSAFHFCAEAHFKLDSFIYLFFDFDSVLLPKSFLFVCFFFT